MRLWGAFMRHLEGHEEFPSSWQDRLKHHDRLIQDLSSARTEARMLTGRLRTGNLIEDMINGLDTELDEKEPKP